jgi:hypothetical protein
VVYDDNAPETRRISAAFDNGEPGANRALLALVLRHLSYSVLIPAFKRASCRSAEDGDGNPSASYGCVITQSYDAIVPPYPVAADRKSRDRTWKA